MKARELLVAVAALGFMVITACGPTTAAPTQAPSVDVGQPVAAVAKAAICQSAVSCQPPSADQYILDCVNKIPYTNVLVEPGTAFEVMDQSGDFKCTQTAYEVKGKSVISCYGRELYTFDLKLTNAACGAGALQTGTGQCDQGYGYDAANQCCAPLGGDDSNSTTIQVNLGGCPLPRGAATPEGTPAP